MCQSTLFLWTWAFWPLGPKSRVPAWALASRAQIPWSGAQIEKSIQMFFPLEKTPAGAQRGYREHPCVFCGRIQYIFEKN